MNLCRYLNRSLSSLCKFVHHVPRSGFKSWGIHIVAGSGSQFVSGLFLIQPPIRVDTCSFMVKLLLCLLLVGACSAATPAAPSEFSGATPLQWSIRMADSEITRLGDKLVWKPAGRAKWDYTAGLFTLSLVKLNQRSPDPRYLQFA